VKKQVSPVVTVIVILVVVVVVALLWNFFTSGGGSSSRHGRGSGMGLNIDMKNADMDTARKNAAKAREGILGQIKDSSKEKGGE